MLAVKQKRKILFGISFSVLTIVMITHLKGKTSTILKSDVRFKENRATKPSLKQDWLSHLDSDTKVIYIFTTLFSQRLWSYMRGLETFRHFYGCTQHTNCLATYNETWLSKAHAALFHGRDVEMYRFGHYSGENLAKVRKIVPKYQKWIFFSQENPQRSEDIYKPYDGLFNWTATFDRKSSVFIPYSSYTELKTSKEVTRNYAKEKTGFVAWAVSNCGLMREKYALELEKYIDITVYGRCNKRFKNQRDCKQNDDICNKEFSSYKFFLAFENDFCNDYVTEKYWLRIMQDVVPVVMGANYDKGSAIQGSYIDVSDFKSIKQLADYLLFLDKNDDQYNKYFKYREKFAIQAESIFCSICAALHNQDGKESTQISLSKNFNYQANCGSNARKIDKLEKQIDESRTNKSISL